MASRLGTTGGWIRVTLGRLFLVAPIAAIAYVLLFPVFFAIRFRSGPPVWSASVDKLTQAVAKYEADYGSLRGTSQKPLIGKVLTSVILDPWGREYRIDPTLGAVVASGVPISGDMTDFESLIVRRYSRDLEIEAVVYEGNLGHPNPGSSFGLWMSKPCSVAESVNPADELLLMTNGGSRPFSGVLLSDGPQYMVHPMSDDSAPKTIWAGSGFVFDSEKSKPEQGLVVVTYRGLPQSRGAPWPAGVVSHGSVVDFHPRVRKNGSPKSGSNSCVRERLCEGSPLAGLDLESARFEVEGAVPSWWTMGAGGKWTLPPAMHFGSVSKRPSKRELPPQEPCGG